MWRRHCYAQQRVLFPVKAGRSTAFSESITAFMFIHSMSEYDAQTVGTHYAKRQRNCPQQALFKRLLRDMTEDKPGRRTNADAGWAAGAIPKEQPLAASISLLEQLGVTDLMQHRVRHETTVRDPANDSAIAAPPFTSAEPEPVYRSADGLSEVCRAGIACRLHPLVVLQKVLEATASVRDNSGPVAISSAAAVILLRSAVERIRRKASQLQRCMDRRGVPQDTRKDGGTASGTTKAGAHEPWSDRGEISQMQWALGEEKQRAYKLLDVLHMQGRLQGCHETIDELHERLKLASALQDVGRAIGTLEKLLPLHAQQLSAVNRPSAGGSYADGHASYESRIGKLGDDVYFAIVALQGSSDFETARVTFERFGKIIEECAKTANRCPFDKDNNGFDGVHVCDKATDGFGAGNTSNNDLMGTGNHTVVAVAATKLKLLAALSHCIRANAAHYTYVQDAVLFITATTDVGYLQGTWHNVREAMCSVLSALSRTTMDPVTKMEAAHLFFSRVQLSSSAEVCESPRVTAALLSAASSARDSSVALLLYNRLAAPNVRMADDAENVAALLLSERCALRDAMRYLSFSQLEPQGMPSSAAQLLAAKLMLQQCESEVVYTVLDLIKPQREVEPQRTFFLRLLAFYRDLQKCNDGWGEEAHLSHARHILGEWCDELRSAGVTTASFTTSQLLCQIRQKLAFIMGRSDAKSAGRDTSSLRPDHEGARLLQCLDDMLIQLSVGWLRHRATTNRTPRFHLGAEQLRHLLDGSRNDITVRVIGRQAEHSGPPRSVIGAIASPAFVGGTTVDAARCQSIAQKAFSSLCAAVVESGSVRGGAAVVLGFSEYVQLCVLEEAGMMDSVCKHRTDGNKGDACVGPSSERRVFNFSLDSFNGLIPLIYVTDALGELLLQEELNAASSRVQSDITIDDFPPDAPVQYLTAPRDEVRQWLLHWLTEVQAFSHNVQGVFERQVELMLRTDGIGLCAASNIEEKNEEEEKDASQGSEQKRQTLSCFVTASPQ